MLSIMPKLAPLEAKSSIAQASPWIVGVIIILLPLGSMDS